MGRGECQHICWTMLQKRNTELSHPSSSYHTREYTCLIFPLTGVTISSKAAHYANILINMVKKEAIKYLAHKK